MSDNAKSFFKQFSETVATWLADLCEEVEAKGPEDAYAWRKLWSQLLFERAVAGEVEARKVVDTYLMGRASQVHEQYKLYASARTASISTTFVTASDTKPEADGSDQSIPGPTATTTSDDGIIRCGSGMTPPSTKGSDGVDMVIQLASDRDGRGKKVAPAGQGELFIITLSLLGREVPGWIEQERHEADNLAEQVGLLSDQLRDKRNLIEEMRRVQDAIPELEDLAQNHRTCATTSELLEAASLRPEEIGLTNRLVSWMDNKLTMLRSTRVG